MLPTLNDFGMWNLPLFGRTHLFLPTYGVLFASSVLVAWWWFTRRARSLRLPDEQIFNLVFYTLLGGILGAKLLLILVDWRFYFSNPVQILGTLRSAGVLMGGVICGALVFGWYARRCGMPLWRLADAIVAPVALAQGIGRLGCFAAGCCWGREVDHDHPLAVVFTNPLAAKQTGVSLNVPLFPTQLVQMAHDVLLAGVLTWMWRRRPRPDGTTFWLYVLLYGLGRGVIEFWRGDRQRGLHFGDLLSTSQLIALAGVVAAALVLFRGRIARSRAEGSSSERGGEATVPAAAEGTRLDRYLAALFPDRTRSSLGRIIRDGLVRVGDREVRKPGHSLRAGDRIVVQWPAEPSLSPTPEEIPLEIVYEDEHLIALIKPAGMVVHQGHGRFSGTLVNALLGRGTTLSPVGAPARPGIVHRLDEGTSGVLVVAKTEAAHHGLAHAFAEREVDKRYTALVWGRPSPPGGRIEKAIGRSRNHPTRMAVESTRGRRRPALTLYSTRESMPGFALLDIELRTGRTHQIRVHMQAIHHPIVGDERYGGRAWRGVQDPLKRRAIRELDRLALHAASLELKHPVTRKRLRVEAPLPASLLALLDVLRGTT